MTAEPLPKDYVDAMQAVVEHCPDPYAQSYARAAHATWMLHGLDSMRDQAMYVLSNAQQWRGSLARATKEVLKSCL
jgi:hypothetical protein